MGLWPPASGGGGGVEIIREVESRPALVRARHSKPPHGHVPYLGLGPVVLCPTQRPQSSRTDGVHVPHSLTGAPQWSPIPHAI